MAGVQPCTSYIYLRKWWRLVWPHQPKTTCAVLCFFFFEKVLSCASVWVHHREKLECVYDRHLGYGVISNNKYFAFCKATLTLASTTIFYGNIWHPIKLQDHKSAFQDKSTCMIFMFPVDLCEKYWWSDFPTVTPTWYILIRKHYHFDVKKLKIKASDWSRLPMTLSSMNSPTNSTILTLTTRLLFVQVIKFSALGDGFPEVYTRFPYLRIHLCKFQDSNIHDRNVMHSEISSHTSITAEAQ